jgi:hypothetical protein
MTVTIEQLRDGSYRVRIAQDGRETAEVAQSRIGAIKCVLAHWWGKRAMLVMR